jgi:hypothetical protein
MEHESNSDNYDGEVNDISVDESGSDTSMSDVVVEVSGSDSSVDIQALTRGGSKDVRSTTQHETLRTVPDKSV